MKRFLYIAVTILFISCAEEDQNKYTLSGSAAGFGDGTKVMVYALENNQPVPVDTILVKDGAFKASYPKTETSDLYYLQVAGFDNKLVYINENENLQAKIYKDSIQASTIRGSVQNDNYQDFLADLRGFAQAKLDNQTKFKIAQSQRDMAAVTQIRTDNINLVNRETTRKKNFIANNSNSIFSAMLLAEMLQRKEITGVEASELADKFSPKIASEPSVKFVKQQIAGMKGSEVGGDAPNFSGPTPTGETLALKDALGEYTLIDFWASWCKPCRRENPNVVKVYNKYHSKGLNIVSVSLDRQGQKDRWIEAIEKDKMDWYHISNLKFWQDPIAQMYNVRSIPATFLLDKDGKIIAKNLRGPALEAKIASLLGS